VVGTREPALVLPIAHNATASSSTAVVPVATQALRVP
jgi:hypothetical protein